MFDILKYIVRMFIKKKKNYLYGSNTVVYKCANIFNNSENEENVILGNDCHIKGELLLFGHGGKIEMGDYCYVGSNTHIWSAKSIMIGNRVLISHNCNIFDNDTHPLDPRERHEQFKTIITSGQPKKIDLKEEDIVIEDDALIAANSIILKGVRIGRCSIVGAGSVVTKNVPPFTIVAGNPARVVREIENGSNRG